MNFFEVLFALQVVDIAASGRCKWPAATGSCKCPNIGESVQTRSLQFDLLQVPIHLPYQLSALENQHQQDK